MSDTPENDPEALQRRRTFLKRMAAAGFAAGAVVTFEPLVANAVTPGEYEIWDWHRRRHTTTTTLAPTTTTLAPTTTTLAPTTTTLAPTTTPAPTTTQAPHRHHHHWFF